MIEWKKTVTGRSRRLAYVPKDAQIVAVNGREVVGTCEVCGHPVVEGQKYLRDSDGVMWHNQCR